MKVRSAGGFVCLGLVCLVGCGGSGSASSQALTGKLEGRPWTFVAGQANAVAAGGAFNVATYPSQYSECASLPALDAIYLNQVPNAVGSFAVDANLNVTFGGPDNISGTGTIVIDAITATTFSGDADLTSSDPATYAKGHFEVAICP